MREILFRGKQCENGEWIEGFYGVKDETCRWPARHYMCISTLSSDCASSYFTDVEVIPETVGQYTGLTDKNGKRIFEGDICRNTKTGEVVSVKWHGTFAGFVWSRRNDNGNLCDFGELFRAHDKYEVIGNIHDNPEVMRGGEQNGTD